MSSPSQTNPSISPSQISGPNIKAKTSAVWEEFEIIDIHSIKCKHCSKIYTCSQDYAKGYSPTNLIQHAKSKHGLLLQKLSDFEISQEKGRRLMFYLIIFVVKFFTSFNFLSSPEFKAFCSELNLNFHVPCAATLKAKIAEKVKDVHNIVKAMLKKAPALSVTADFWSNKKMEHFVTVTGSMIDNCWKLQRCNIDTKVVREIHITAEIVSGVFDAIFLENQLADVPKFFASDAGSNIKKALRNQKWSHCFAHKIDHLIKDSMKPAAALMSKVKEIIKKVKYSSVFSQELTSQQKAHSRPGFS